MAVHNNVGQALVKQAFLASVCTLVLIVGLPPQSVAAPNGCQLPATSRLSQRPWSQQRLGFERVWQITTGVGVVVGVVDTGVDASHPQLRGHVLDGYNEVTRGAPANTDCDGHGTFVAGIIAAQHDDRIGFAGVAPGAMILPIKETDATTAGKGTVHDLARSIRDAVELGAQVVNVSVVTGTDDPELRAAVRHALDRDVVIVAAAGNDAASNNIPYYPASYPGVLAVGAIDQSGNRSAFSETGAIGVVAPGNDLISTGAGGDGLLAGGAGTSYAAPFVTGVAALVRSYHPKLTAAQVIRRIEITADHPAGPLPNRDLGWGVVNPNAAVIAVLPEEGPRPVATLSPSPVPRPAVVPPSTDRSGDVALGLAAAAVGLSVVAGSAAVLLPRGRSRGWRPGSWQG